MIFYFYFTLFFILFFSGKTCGISKDVKVNLDVLNILFISLFVALFMGLRATDIGKDSIVYLNIFKNKDSYENELEKGFLLLNKILKVFSDNENYYLFSLSFLITFVTIFVYYKLNNKNYCWYFLLYISFYYFYQFNLNIIREGIAIVFVSLAFLCYKEKKYIQTVLFFIIAISFHITSLVFIFYPFFDKFIANKKRVWFLLLFIFIFFFFHLTSKLISIIPEFHWAIGKIKWYFHIATPVKIKQTHLISMAIIFFFLMNYERMKESPFFSYYQFHMTFFAFLSFFSESVLVFDRFYFYLQFYEPLLIYEFRILFKEKKVFDILIIIFIILMSSFTIFIWGPRNFITPYSLQFFK